jgi:hypothetical protein
MSQGILKSVQRRTAKRRAALVLDIMSAEPSPQEATCAHRPDLGRYRGLERAALAPAESALRARLKDEEALKDEQVKKVKQKVGELVFDIPGSGVARACPPLPRRGWPPAARLFLRPPDPGAHQEMSRLRILLAVSSAQLPG